MLAIVMPNFLRLHYYAVLSVSLACLQMVIAAPGGFDPSFDYNGIVITNFQAGRSINMPPDFVVVQASGDSMVSMALQPDGKILAVGHRDRTIMRLTPTAPLYDLYDPFDFAVARYLPNGALDPSFGTAGRVTTDMGSSQEIAAGAFTVDGGKILVVGNCDGKTGLVRYLPDGTLDTSFGNQGRAYLDFPLNWECSPIQQPDGKILIAGNQLLRLDPDGTLDETFGMGGRAALPAGVSAMTLLPDGSILLAGSKNDYNRVLMRVTSAGVLDSGFGVDGVAAIDLFRINDIAVLPDGKYAAVTGWGGIFPAYENSKFCVARINANGTLDQSFGNGGKVVVGFDEGESFSTQIAIGADGRIIAGGFILGSGSDDAMALTRFDADGTLDATFGNQGKVVSYLTHPPAGYWGPVTMSSFERTNALLVQPDGKILIGGTVYTAYSSSSYDFFLARLLIDDSPSSANYEPEVVLEPDLPENSATKARSVRHSKSRSITVTVRNLGTRIDGFRLHAKVGNREIRMKVTDGSKDITAPISKGRYETAFMSPEDLLTLQVTVRPTAKFRRSSKVNVRVSATSTSDNRSTTLASVQFSGRSFK